MIKKKYLILGAGPAGLTLANMLLDRGEEDFLLLEKEDVAGGLCRTEYVGSNPVDIGGGHILDVRSQRVCDYMFRFLPKDKWNIFDRDSKIRFQDQFMGSPFESHIWQLPVEDQVRYIKSVAIAGCNLGTPKPEKFVDWIRWKLGDEIAENYMLPYNRKMFTSNLDSLGTYWLEKLPDVSFEDTLMSCLEHRFYGKHPGHARFYYPDSEGYGDAFILMQKRLGDKFLGRVRVTSLDVENRVVNGEFTADHIISTIPWTDIEEYKGLEDEYISMIGRLKYSGIQVDYHKQPLPFETKAHWIYYPQECYAFHRILVLFNFSPRSEGYWTETNLERVDMTGSPDIKSGAGADLSYKNIYAYPHNTLDKPEIMAKLLPRMEKSRITGLGRWGEWQHYNSDVVMEKAMDLAQKL